MHNKLTAFSGEPLTLAEKQQKYRSNLHCIPNVLLEKIEMAFHIELTHNSTAIEGNTLNHKATLFVEDCITRL